MSRCWVIYTYINQQQQPSMKGFTKAWTSLKNILFDQTPLVLACVTDNLPEKSDRPFPNLNLMMSVQNSVKYLNLYHLLVLLHKNSKVLKYYSGHCKKKKKNLTIQWLNHFPPERRVLKLYNWWLQFCSLYWFFFNEKRQQHYFCVSGILADNKLKMLTQGIMKYFWKN